MSRHYHRHRRCCGCNQNNFYCPPTGTGRDRCTALGPFVAIDSNCIVPPALTGSIIPFSSGITPAVLVSAAGLIGTTSLIGFGTAIPGVTVVGETIDLLGAVLTEAFAVPREGSITSISASFRTTEVTIDLGAGTTVNATIYRAPAGSNTFTATDASVDLAPTLTGIIAVGTTLSGTSSNFAPVQVFPGDRLLMVFSVVGPLVATVTGAASAGINIE